VDSGDQERTTNFELSKTEIGYELIHLEDLDRIILLQTTKLVFYSNGGQTIALRKAKIPTFVLEF